MDFDIIVEEFLWQAHVNGCFAYADCCGGPDVILREMQGHSLSAMPILCIRWNTTSPAHRQVLGYYRYSDDQIRAVLDKFLCLTMPCPVELLFLIVQITRLCVKVAAKPRSPIGATARTKTMFSKADDFALDIWVEESSLSNKNYARY
ncbi:hypothetical protein LMH87_000188 [Akanthomyces muscarius]|uniref:Uncharacterized protein n=1 Tax=Akanthomyces muscarius TaxID=2231603 RepID=A0A9W8QE24_AKAMU|nr:hypothetical protein LMH87_000188 [Akanthomyces muscarius]KAJ4154917.1 hypothetical protein LMH87_000188 [Akanthomyces muscarius]